MSIDDRSCYTRPDEDSSIGKKSSDDDSTTEEVCSDTETIDLSLDIPDINSVGKNSPEPGTCLILEGEIPGSDRYNELMYKAIGEYSNENVRKMGLVIYRRYIDRIWLQ